MKTKWTKVKRIDFDAFALTLNVCSTPQVEFVCVVLFEKKTG